MTRTRIDGARMADSCGQAAVQLRTGGRGASDGQARLRPPIPLATLI
jgi:hypothetical protein